MQEILTFFFIDLHIVLLFELLFYFLNNHRFLRLGRKNIDFFLRITYKELGLIHKVEGLKSQSVDSLKMQS